MTATDLAKIMLDLNAGVRSCVLSRPDGENEVLVELGTDRFSSPGSAIVKYFECGEYKVADVNVTEAASWFMGNQGVASIPMG